EKASSDKSKGILRPLFKADHALRRGMACHTKPPRQDRARKCPLTFACANYKGHTSPAVSGGSRSRAKYGLALRSPSLRRAKHGQEWIRTTEGVKPADLHSVPLHRKIRF